MAPNRSSTPSDASGQTGPAVAVATNGPDPVVAGVGAAIRAHRQAAGLSMRELASRAGMSQPFLSNLENARAMPSIATLYKLATALGIGPQEFLPGPVDRDAQLVRAGTGPSGPVGDEPGSALSQLICGAPGRLIEAHTYEIEPGQPVGEWFEHDGEDLLVMLEGHLSVDLADGRRFELGPGDALWHLSTRPHRWWATGSTPARALLVNARAPAAPGALHRPR